jgi:hypothetical protein
MANQNDVNSSVPKQFIHHVLLEFLTDWTTCTNEMAKKTTYEKYCQKEPLLGGQATRGTCRLGQSRQEGAAIPKAGMFPGR